MGSRLSLLLLLLGDQASSSVTTAIHVEMFAVTPEYLFAAIIYIGKNHFSDSFNASLARLGDLELERRASLRMITFTIQTAF